jgi:hypothetical protein
MPDALHVFKEQSARVVEIDVRLRSAVHDEGVATVGPAIGLDDRPLRTLFVGLAISLPWVGVAIALANAPNGALKFVGALLGLAWIALALVGTASIALRVGTRGETAPPRWTTVARGAGFVALTWMLPILGWFVVLPLTLACGVGCLVGRHVGRHGGRPTLPPASEPTPPLPAV